MYNDVKPFCSKHTATKDPFVARELNWTDLNQPTQLYQALIGYKRHVTSTYFMLIGYRHIELQNVPIKNSPFDFWS